ncbi:hypothetical protein GMOD_00008034 [Pyrenophora seminiperda CCB06]|uniref:Uncharacterized protein n=1 Tax=Pyrenophora seminiperda CCB06 TaxID=1302712 RepID=A0A3M7MG82_9PLEO|nr:hypothetical protein GMOD_00008034 [Pyrenophora seminiperda CCB06]
MPISTKNTCPLCRYELFFLRSSHEPREPRVVGVLDSATRILGSTSVGSLSASEPPHEVELSPNRTNTAAHHCFETHPGPCSAHHQHTRQDSHSYTRNGRESSRHRTLVADIQTEFFWNTALTDDNLMVFLNEDERVNVQYLRETPSYELYYQDALPDFAFDQLLIGHAQWMRELDDEAGFSELDGLDTSYNFCACLESNALAAHSELTSPDRNGSLPSLEFKLLQDAVLLVPIANSGGIFLLALPPLRIPPSALKPTDSLGTLGLVSDASSLTSSSAS